LGKHHFLVVAYSSSNLGNSVNTHPLASSDGCLFILFILILKTKAVAEPPKTRGVINPFPFFNFKQKASYL